MADVSRDDRERAKQTLKAFPFYCSASEEEALAQAITTARAEGEAQGRAELGATLVRDLGAMATSLAGQSEGSTAAALKATAELATVQARLESSNEYIFRAWQPLRNAGSEESDLPTAIEAVTQREAVHLALIAELAEALCFFLPQRNTHPVPVDELLARASDATRNVRVIELGECEVKHAILYLGDTATPVLSPDNGAIDRAEAAALEGASGPCTASLVVRMGGENA